MRIRWSEAAVADLASIREYIARTSPVLARDVVTRLYEAVGQLEAFPDSGRTVPERNDPRYRELVRKPFRIVYERTPEACHILTVFHATRELPAGFEDVSV